MLWGTLTEPMAFHRRLLEITFSLESGEEIEIIMSEFCTPPWLIIWYCGSFCTVSRLSQVLKNGERELDLIFATTLSLSLSHMPLKNLMSVDLISSHVLIKPDSHLFLSFAGKICGFQQSRKERLYGSGFCTILGNGCARLAKKLINTTVPRAF